LAPDSGSPSEMIINDDDDEDAEEFIGTVPLSSDPSG
jgi:hypothetical protein